jgi:hypothetical protein
VILTNNLGQAVELKPLGWEHFRRQDGRVT